MAIESLCPSLNDDGPLRQGVRNFFSACQLLQYFLREANPLHHFLLSANVLRHDIEVTELAIYQLQGLGTDDLIIAYCISQS